MLTNNLMIIRPMFSHFDSVHKCGRRQDITYTTRCIASGGKNKDIYTLRKFNETNHWSQFIKVYLGVI